MGSILRYLAIAVIGCHASPGWSAPAESIEGTWQLVSVIVPSMIYSNPRGISAVKEHYTGDGRLFFIGPTETLNSETPFVQYSVIGGVRTVKDEGMTRQAAISFLSPQLLQVTQEHGDIWCYRRMDGRGAPDRRIEPISVERVGKNLSCASSLKTAYDTRDYSALPVRKRMLGQWEVVANRNVPRSAAPEYGLLNDVWLITEDAVSILYRQNPKDGWSTQPYSFEKKAIVSRFRDGTTFVIPVSFDEWGHLVLRFDGHEMILKRMTQYPSKTPDVPPLTITLLSLEGEE